MTLRSMLATSAFLLLAGARAQAIPIQVDFEKALIPGPIDVSPLPFLMNGSNRALLLKYSVPNASLITSINSVTVELTVFDDDDRGDEFGSLYFGLPGPNLYMTSFGGFFPTSPTTLTASLSTGDIALATTSILDGTFRVRIERDAGDFWVSDGKVTIDAEMVPEPATFLFVAPALLGLRWLARRRRV